MSAPAQSIGCARRGMVFLENWRLVREDMALSMETQLQNIFEDVVVKCIFIERDMANAT